jgi:hypothetical protein
MLSCLSYVLSWALPGSSYIILMISGCTPAGMCSMTDPAPQVFTFLVSRCRVWLSLCTVAAPCNWPEACRVLCRQAVLYERSGPSLCARGRGTAARVKARELVDHILIWRHIVLHCLLGLVTTVVSLYQATMNGSMTTSSDTRESHSIHS